MRGVFPVVLNRIGGLDGIVGKLNRQRLTGVGVRFIKGRPSACDRHPDLVPGGKDLAHPADVKAAQQAAVDVEAVRVAVRSHLDKYFDAAPAVDEELATTLVEFCARIPELVDYEAHFRRSEATLLDELKAVVEPSGVKLVASANHYSADIVFVAAYGESIERIARITRNAKQQLAAHQQLVVGIRLGFYSPGMGTAVLSEQELNRVVDTAISHGADTVAFYNYGEAPRRCVEWIRGISAAE